MDYVVVCNGGDQCDDVCGGNLAIRRDYAGSKRGKNNAICRAQ
jgi:hypothetical protein